MPTYAANPSGRRVYPEWPFSFAILHRRGALVTFLRGRHCDRCPSSPSGMCNILPLPWQIGLPQDQVHICHPGSLGGTCILPLSAPCSVSCRNISCSTTQLVGGSKTPPGVFIQEEFQVHLPLQFPNRDPSFSSPLPSHQLLCIWPP